MKTLKDYEYFGTENGVLYCGDNMEILPLITERIDLCLTDPPYGIGAEKPEFSKGMNGLRKNGSLKYDKTWKNRKIKEYPNTGTWDIKKNNVIEYIRNTFKKFIIWGGNYYTDVLKPTNGWFIWDKKINENFDLSKCELAYCNFYQSTFLFSYLWAGYAKQVPEERFHPTQKPVALMVWCIEKSKTTGIILDPFLGSGTTALACEKLNRKWIGIEISEKYCEIAKKRVEEYTSQLKLFK